MPSLRKLGKQSKIIVGENRYDFSDFAQLSNALARFRQYKRNHRRET